MSRPGSQIRPTFVPGDDSLLDGTWHGPSPEDCRDLLQMLGLLTPDTSELGSYYTEPGSLT